MLLHFVPLAGHASLSVSHCSVFFFFSLLTLFNQQTTNEMKISHSVLSISTLRSWALKALYFETYLVI